MSLTLAECLRRAACGDRFPTSDLLAGSADALDGQAAEIDRLRRLLARYRDETPLEHQPTMIAHEVDQVLGREQS